MGGGSHKVRQRPLYGLVLTGGKSRRMNRDKALIPYRAAPHAAVLRNLLRRHCAEVYLSARDGQWRGTALEGLPTIADLVENQGPIGGILSAFARHGDANWFVVACDLPHFNEAAADRLLQNFDEEKVATCYRNSEKGFTEALCAIYSPAARPLLEAAAVAGNPSPVKVLQNADCIVIEPGRGVNLANANTPEDFVQAVDHYAL